MSKHKLDLDALSIESFCTVEMGTERGTVRAHADTVEVGCMLSPAGGVVYGDDTMGEAFVPEESDDFASLQRTCTWSMKSACERN